MSVCESSITNPKKQLEFYRDLSEQLQVENKQLNKQLEEINKFKFSYKKDETKIPPVIKKQNDVEIIKKVENQQKEFIEYMNKTIEKLECDDVVDELRDFLADDEEYVNMSDEEYDKMCEEKSKDYFYKKAIVIWAKN